MRQKDPVDAIDHLLEFAKGGEVRVKVLNSAAWRPQDDISTDQCLLLFDQEAGVVVEVPRCEQGLHSKIRLHHEFLLVTNRLDCIPEVWIALKDCLLFLIPSQ